MTDVESAFQVLIDALRTIDCVLAIGKTGGAALPADGQSDIDLFVFCDHIPVKEEREARYASLKGLFSVSEYGEQEHPHWGLVDSLLIGNQEVYPMYFTGDAFASSIDSILRGERTEREENYFYPTGRCASILGMHPLYDPEGFLADLKERCAPYPDALRAALLSSHLPKICDEEDFNRAVSRGDVLFYHSTFDLAIDHFLQALFALNRVYFPSRKRSPEMIQSFTLKPEDAETRLMRAVQLGAHAETLAESCRIWKDLALDFSSIL